MVMRFMEPQPNLEEVLLIFPGSLNMLGLDVVENILLYWNGLRLVPAVIGVQVNGPTGVSLDQSLVGLRKVKISAQT